jgi:hypothetical protein
MRDLEPTMQTEWLKLLGHDQLVAITRLSSSPDGVDLSKLSDGDLEQIIAGDLAPLRKLCGEEEWGRICGE